MSAATRIRALQPETEIVVLEMSRFTSYSACGIPFVVGGLVAGGVEALVARSPDEHRRRGIDVRTHHEATAIDVAAGEVEFLDQHAGTFGRLGVRPTDDRHRRGAGAPRPPRHRPAVRPRRADARRRPGAARPGVRELPAGRHRRWWLHRPGDGRGVRRAGVHGHGRREGDAAARCRRRRSRCTGRRGACGRTGSTCAAASPSTASSRGSVLTSDGPIDADLVVLGIGVRARSELAEAAGIELAAGGAVRVDDRQATSADGVWSAGDCATSTHLCDGAAGAHRPRDLRQQARPRRRHQHGRRRRPRRPGPGDGGHQALLAGGRPDRAARRPKRSRPASMPSPRPSTRRRPPATCRTRRR